MNDFYTYITSAASFVHIAVVCYILGLLTRRELLLRGLLLLGTAFYILYYYFIADTPLWEAIFASVLIGIANLMVIWRIIRERSTLGMSEEMQGIFRHFPNFNPGQFRTLMARGRIVRDSEETTLLQEGVETGRLYLTLGEGFVVNMGTQHAEIGPGNFLGEISFLLGGPATAQVLARKGSTYVMWEKADLAAMMEKSPAMANAVSVLLNKDIASKLAVSFPIRARSILPPTVT